MLIIRQLSLYKSIQASTHALHTAPRCLKTIYLCNRNLNAFDSD